MTAKCVHKLHAKHEFGKTKRFAAIAEHSRGIADRIGGVGRVRCLRVTWGLDFLTAELEYTSDTAHSPLTHLDKEYLKLQLLASKWRHDFDAAWDLRLLEFMASESESNVRDPNQPSLRTISVAMENLTQAECGFFEKYLFVKTKPPNHIFHQCARQLELERVGAARKEALVNRLVKYRAIAGSTQSHNFTDDILTEVSVAMDIVDINDNDKLKLEQKWAEARIATWRTCTSSNEGVAQAIFAAHPDADCTNNPELFKLMVARGCTVFDFAWKDTLEPPVSFDNIKDIPRIVSFLRCPNQWLLQLTELARSNPQIMAVETDDLDASELQVLLQENMNAWGTNAHMNEWGTETSNLKFSFCFTGGFTAIRDSMKLEDLIVGSGVLFVGTGRPEVMPLCPGAINLNRGTSRFTVELPSKGVHRILIQISSGGYCDYCMRKVWVDKLRDDSDSGDEMDSMLDRSLGELYFSWGSSTSDILPVVMGTRFTNRLSHVTALARVGIFFIVLYTKEGEPEGFSDVMRYWTVEGSIPVCLSQHFGSIDPHIWAIDGRSPVLPGARDKLSFFGVGRAMLCGVLAAVCDTAKFWLYYGVYWICPIFGGGMGPMSNLQNPKTGYFNSRSLISQSGTCNGG
ncbi:hypothetical protein C8J57DRAFT_1484381 [Mycena rebaudengoi]|nr:hypothetical protein C8J57DRAFT_1484381 [Mycena rebaudengoi]